MSFSSGESAALQHPLPGFLAKFPTPFHVYFEKEALTDARELEKGLKSGLSGVELFYSVKTNPLAPLLKVLLNDGWGMEVVGTENLAAALGAGCPGEHILYNGAAWTRDELREAISQHKIRRFTADSPAQANLLANVWKSITNAPPLELAFRVHDQDSHFGMNGEQLKAALAAIPGGMLFSFGLHIHTNPHGSYADPAEIAADFRSRARVLKAAAAELGREPDYFDLGGGFDSPYVYRPHPKELSSFHNPAIADAFRSRFSAIRFSLEDTGCQVSKAVADELGPVLSKKRILFEPGRAVCTRALSTVVEVRAVKDGFYPDAQVVITDGSTASMGPLHRGVHPLSPAGEHKTFVYGALPHGADWLFQNVKLPRLTEGDRLTIHHTGAYFLPLESKFGHELPGIYRVDRVEKLR